MHEDPTRRMPAGGQGQPPQDPAGYQQGYHVYRPGGGMSGGTRPRSRCSWRAVVGLGVALLVVAAGGGSDDTPTTSSASTAHRDRNHRAHHGDRDQHLHVDQHIDLHRGGRGKAAVTAAGRGQRRSR